jgi:response regulator NasT
MTRSARVGGDHLAAIEDRAGDESAVEMAGETGQKRRLHVLLVDDSDERRASVAASLAGAGCDAIGFVSSQEDVLRRVQQSNLDVVIIDLESPGRDTLDSLQTVQSTAPRPIVMFTQDDDGATIARATRAGVSAYVVDGISKKRVRPILDAAIERFQQFRGLAEELEKTRAQLEERRVVDKAKSILMKQRVMSEDEAYKALRSLAMSSNKRLAQVAESDVDAAKLLL